MQMEAACLWDRLEERFVYIKGYFIVTSKVARVSSEKLQGMRQAPP